MRTKWMLILLLATALGSTGCARLKDLERINRQQAATIVSLNNEVLRLSDELDMLARSQNDLARAKADLEHRLSSEVSEGGLDIAMSDRGIVVTMLDHVLFDSGKAALKSSAESTLNKVAEVIRADAPDNRVFVEGHTDSDPIRSSGWRSNWELSTARATEVIHYLTDNAEMDPQHFVASGYGEYRPVADNSNREGKQQNRRVEIIISPSKTTDMPAMNTGIMGAQSSIMGESEAALIK